MAAWGEIGLSYAYLLYQKRYDRISVGASVKRLFGLAGAYLSVDQMDYVVPDDSTMIINNMAATAGYCVPVDYNTNEMITGNWVRGGGFGFDIGATYTRTLRSAYKQYIRRPCELNYEDYLYRIGMALMDIGRIQFKDNAEAYRIDNRVLLLDRCEQPRFRSHPPVHGYRELPVLWGLYLCMCGRFI